jgi:hypothetical protein
MSYIERITGSDSLRSFPYGTLQPVLALQRRPLSPLYDFRRALNIWPKVSMTLLFLCPNMISDLAYTQGRSAIGGIPTFNEIDSAQRAIGTN